MNNVGTESVVSRAQAGPMYTRAGKPNICVGYGVASLDLAQHKYSIDTYHSLLSQNTHFLFNITKQL